MRRRGREVVRYPHPATLAGVLQKAIASLGVDLVLDVGAFNGWYVDMLRDEVGYRGRVVSFEPSPAALRVLTSKARGDPAWDVRPVALGGELGTATLNVYENGPLSSFHDQSAYAKETWNFDTPTEVDVEVSTLAVELPRLDGSNLLIKIDTQGHDLTVLAGADGALGPVRLLQVEVPQEPLYEGVPGLVPFLDRITTLGFELLGLFPSVTEDQGQHSDDALRVIEFDGLFYRR